MRSIIHLKGLDFYARCRITLSAKVRKKNNESQLVRYIKLVFCETPNVTYTTTKLHEYGDQPYSVPGEGCFVWYILMVLYKINIFNYSCIYLLKSSVGIHPTATQMYYHNNIIMISM